MNHPNPAHAGRASVIYEPALFGFRELFYGSADAGSQTGAEGRFGFHDGASVLLTGGPGSGKTTFAFACARDLLFRYRTDGLLQRLRDEEFSNRYGDYYKEKHEDPPPAPGVDRLYYISLEVTRERLGHMYREMGWMENSDLLFGKQRVDCLREFVPSFSEDRPPPTPEETLNDILRRIREDHRLHDPGAVKIIVIVDSLNALLRDCPDRGEARRQTYEFLIRLRSTLGKYKVGEVDHDRLALAFLVSEDALSRREDIPVSEYVTDFVFRFDTQDTGGNRKLRTFESIKSQGANMRIGRHTWAVVSARDCNKVFTQREVMDRMRWSGQRGWPAFKCLASRQGDNTLMHWALEIRQNISPLKNNDWGTVAVFPKAGMRPLEDGAPLPKGSIFSGIPGLDAMLELKEEYWARAALYYPRKDSRSLRGIIRGTTTLLMGPAGTGKTTMSLQFLQGDLVSGRFAGGPTGKDCHVLYVNFENPFDHVLRLYPGKWGPLKAAWKEPDGFEKDGVRLHLHTLHRARANLDSNLLLAEIRYLMAVHPIERIAIDGLASLLATTEPEDYRALAETLVTAIQSARSAKDKVTVFLTYEATQGHGHDNAPPLHLSGVADNLIILRQIPMGNERRTCIEVAKARHQRHDRMVREVRVKNTSEAKDELELPLAIRPGFENYAGILESKIRPVEVYLQMFSENQAEERMNKWLGQHLGRNFDYKVRDFGFSRHAISRTLEDLTSDANRIPTSDIRLLSVDEWWIRDHSMDQHPLLWLVPFEPQARESRETHKVDPIQTGIATSLSDFWAPEVEKASLLDFKVSEPDEDGLKKLDPSTRRTRLMALPCYMDFGMFCINLKFDPTGEGWPRFLDQPAATFGEDLKEKQKHTWNELLGHLPRVWAKPSSRIPGWFALKKRKQQPVGGDRRPEAWRKWESICDAAVMCTQEEGTLAPKWLFSFDMEVPEVAFSAFLEFAWSFGASETCFTQDAVSPPSDNSKADTKSLIDALCFLMFLVHEGLMPSSPKMDDARDSLFCRLYYSNFVHLTAGTDQPPAYKKVPARKDSLGEAHRLGEKLKHSPPAEPLMMVPFFPVGLTSRRTHVQCFASAFEDMATRLQRLSRRVLAAVLAAMRGAGQSSAEEQQFVKALMGITNGARQARQAVKDACDSGDENNLWSKGLEGLATMEAHTIQLRESCWMAQRKGYFHPPGDHTLQDMVDNLCTKLGNPEFRIEEDEKCKLLQECSGIASFDLRDALEILRWHEMRVTMLRLQLEGGRLTKANLFPGSGPADVPEKSAPVDRSRVTSLSGYPCTGSWMIGLFRTTQSPGLSSKYMEEICSLESAHERARLGAGLPSRKDFYEFYGDDPVAYAGYLTWNELHRSLGCRARRRERSLCNYVPVSRVTELVHQQMRTCFTMAAEKRSRPGKDDVKAMIDQASASIDAIIKEAARLMENSAKKRHAQDKQGSLPAPCTDCPHPGKCQEYLVKKLNMEPPNSTNPKQP